MASHHLILGLLQLYAVHFMCAQTRLTVELEGGSDVNEGRVILKWFETLHGTLCYEDFDDRDAKAICNILGKSSSGAKATRFPSRESDIWIVTGLGCRGDETDLRQCHIGGWGPPTCEGNEDAGVICGRVNGRRGTSTTTTLPTTTSTSTTTTSPTTTSTSTTTTSPTTTSTSTTTTSPTTTSTSTTTTSPTTTSTSTTTTSPTTTSTSTTTTTPTTTSTSTTTSPTTTSTSTTTTSTSTSTTSPTTTSTSTTTTSTSTSTTSPTATSTSTTPTTSPTTPSTTTSASLQTTTQPAPLDVRLTLERSGRIVIEIYGIQGFICSDGFELKDARVICRSFGLPDTNVRVKNFDHTGGVIWFTNVQCQGTETTIDDCRFDDELIVSNCNSGQNIGVVCGPTQSSLPAFLVGGPDDLHGRLVLQYNGVNGTVCDDMFGTPEATVVCRMLGYSGPDIYSGGTYYGPGSSTLSLWLDDVRCTGDENDISECAHRGWGVTNCDHSEDVGVHCGPRVIPANQTPVALVDGPDKNHGRLLVRHNNEYGTVCDDGFDTNDARVVCRMLGYSGEEAFYAGNYYGRGSSLRNIWLDEVNCTGTEADIADCTHNGWGRTDCFHSEDVSILCGPRLSPERQVPVSLLGGPDRLHGRLYVWYNGKPGTVCDDGFGRADALVICRMLGYSGDGVSLTTGYGSGAGQIWLSNVLCLGYELSIGDCYYPPWGTHSCFHFEDVGINCGPITGSLQVFLVDGPDRLHGRVVLQDNGVNGTVCDDSFNITDARVICRMLGYTGSDVYAAGNLFGSGSSDLNVWLDELECVGTETDISKCPHGGWGIHDCAHSEDISVLCGPKVAARPELGAYLVDGPNRLHGRLVVEYNRQNGTVCNNDFETADARVICRMLGYRGSQVTAHRIYGPGSGRIWLDKVYCVGNEAHIGDCFYPSFGTHDCDHAQDVSISCGQTPVSGPVKAFLVAGPDDRHGRLVLQYSGVNGTVCADRFDDRDARVVCRMLGYRNSDAYSAGNLYGIGQNSMPILLDDLQCTGNENDISRCAHGGWGIHNCTHERDVSVLCGPLAAAINSSLEVHAFLVDGPDALHGRLVVEYNGENGTVCSDVFGRNGARVVCRMLGYSGNDTYPSRSYGPGSGRVWLDDVFCYGHESSISNCLHPPWGTHKCVHLEDMGVNCGPIIGSPPYCGSTFRGKIYGGRSAASAAWPQIVKIVTYNATHNSHCGGSIIGREWILTAAHCFYNFLKYPPTVRVTAGTVYAGTLLTRGVRVFGSRIWVHPLYNSTHSYDIGLIRLRTNLTYSRTVQPTCLNTVKNAVPIADCYIAGWGKQREGGSPTSTYLQQAKYPIVSDFNCRHFQPFNYNSHLCAGYANGSITACKGDSGGPLICRRPNSTSWDQWGISQSSRPNGCGPQNGDFTLWTEVAQFLPWIRSITNL